LKSSGHNIENLLNKLCIDNDMADKEKEKEFNAYNDEDEKKEDDTLEKEDDEDYEDKEEDEGDEEE